MGAASGEAKALANGKARMGSFQGQGFRVSVGFETYIRPKH